MFFFIIVRAVLGYCSCFKYPVGEEIGDGEEGGAREAARDPRE